MSKRFVEVALVSVMIGALSACSSSGTKKVASSSPSTGGAGSSSASSAPAGSGAGSTSPSTAAGSGGGSISSSAPAGSGGEPNSSAATAGKPATGTPIVFGTNGSDHGNGFDQYQFQDGFVAWAKQVTADGGVGGHPITVKRCNDEGSPTGSATCARQQIADSSIIATMGFTAYSGFVSGPAYKAANLAYVAPYPVSSADFSVLPAVTTPGTLGAFAGLPNYLAKHGYTRFGVIRTDVASTTTLVNEIKGALVGTSGTFAVDIPSPIATTDYSSAISQAIAAKADVLLLGVQTSAYVPIFKAAKAQGYTGAFGIPGTASTLPDVLQGQASTGVKLFADADFPDVTTSSDPAIVQFRAAMKAAGYPDSELGQAAIDGYVTGLLFGRTLEQVGPDSVTRQSFLSEISTAEITGVPLLSTSVGASTAPSNARPVINPTFYVLGYLNGKASAITGQTDLKSVIQNIKF
jgi:ABC-type branched-subunit amino acid transport system substrate-binding protein